MGREGGKEREGGREMEGERVKEGDADMHTYGHLLTLYLYMYDVNDT